MSKPGRIAQCEKGSSASMCRGRQLQVTLTRREITKTTEITMVERERMFENVELEKNMNGKEEDKTV